MLAKTKSNHRNVKPAESRLSKPLNRSRLTNQRGLATLETVPLLLIFVFLISYALGLFGVIHAGTLHAIGARTYAFETFRQRTDLNYFRENGSALNGSHINFASDGFRYHSVRHPAGAQNRFQAPARRIAFAFSGNSEGNREAVHNEQVFVLSNGSRNTGVKVSPAWIMMAHGICLNPKCGSQ